MTIQKFTKNLLPLLTLVVQLLTYPVAAQITQIGNGSYTNSFPGVDAANRNSFPSGTPQLSELAASKPVPTNDWWSLLIKNDHADNLFNYPMALKTKNDGLVVSYIPWGVYDDQEPIIVGVTGLNATRATVADYSDWTVTMDWKNSTHNLQATSGIGMPFLYFNKNSEDIAQIKVNLGDVTISNEMLIVANARNDADFVIYAPLGSTWVQNGTTYTSELNGENYWSMVMIPLTASSISSVAEEYKKYAYVFPINTTTSWSYDQNSSVLRTQFNVETEIKEGIETNVLMGLLPHQWANLAPDSPQPDKYSYSSVRGEIKTMDGNSFSVENTFNGILPTLPYLNNYSESFNIAAMNGKVEQLENDGLNSWTDSYNEGQMMNRLIQTARIADQIGNFEARDKMIATVKERLEDWLSAESGEVAFLFYYNSDWSTMIGYPAGHGQDNNINDHHFHWGYFIHAASFIEQFEPGWANEWGDMVNLLITDAASADRADSQFPFLRNFSPYAGHCWANGFATFPQGNDQESTSESMQFNSSLIHWGSITGNDEIRDLGIYLYTTEQTAIEEYWFDMNERNFSPSQQYSLVSRVWGNSYDNGTFWTSDIAASYGIELYPIHGGSLYLGHNTNYVEKLWNEIEANTGILSNQANDNLWHDIMWEYLAFIDPQKAIDLYDSYPQRNLKFGVSDAQTYYWLHSLNAIGEVDISITSDHPLAAVFTKDEVHTYVAHNYNDTPLTVSFSDGFTLEVAPKSMATNRDLTISGELSASFTRAYTNGSIDLSLSIENGTISRADFYDAGLLLGTVSDAPFVFRASNLSAGVHDFYSKIYVGEEFGVSNIVSAVVGNQTAFGGSSWEITGVIEAGKYDEFEGGFGQGITYSDVTLSNHGDFRTEEAADAALNNAEGATIGWVNGGEWLEYSIDVQNPGLYSLAFRYASENANGGGPFYIELDDQPVSEEITVGSTNGWDKWQSKTISGIPLSGGDHVLRIRFNGGELNLGRMTFSFEDVIPYSQPIARAGANIVVVLPENSTQLDGSESSDPDGGLLTYSWEQVYGPSVISFSANTIANPEISSLEEGIYLLRLVVSNGDYSDSDEMYVIVSQSANVSPVVSINSPTNDDSFIEGKDISISAVATDLDGTISMVEFFANGISIGSSSEKPYAINWTDDVGDYELTALATDDGGNSSTSAVVLVHLTEAPPCDGLAVNGEFGYIFSDDSDNPTITFVPSVPGVGSPTCILYYGTSPSGPYPGYNVTPDVPFQISAEEGSTVYFYYTYSYPGQGEHSTAGDLLSYVVGSCTEEVVLGIERQSGELVNVYPNPVESTLNINFVKGQTIDYLRVTSMDGRIQNVEYTIRKSGLVLDFSSLSSGVYTIFFESNGIPNYFRIVKL